MIADQDPVSDLVPDDVRVIFCVSCFRRDMQLLAAMAINCAVWWSLRRHWRLAICTFGEDEATIAKIKKHFDNNPIVAARFILPHLQSELAQKGPV